nr:MAG TPA: Single strand binding protein [Caudoviricetes sp.]
MLNNVILMGRLASFPEVMKTTSGLDVMRFTVAVERDYKDANGNRPTDFLDCVAWRETAKAIAKYFAKGSMIAVSGNIETRKYTDKNNNKRVATEVKVNSWSFTGEKREEPKREPPVQPAGADEFQMVDSDDDLPF